MNLISNETRTDPFNVSGLIDDPNSPVWVNGVQGTNNGDGTWSAANVPVSAGGVANFDVTTGGTVSSSLAISFVQEKEPKIVVELATWNNNYFMYGNADIHEAERITSKGNFTYGQGGCIHETFEALNTNRVATYTRWTDSILASDGAATLSVRVRDTDGNDNTVAGSAYALPTDIGELHWRGYGGNSGWDVNGQTRLKLIIGGKRAERKIYELTGAATEQLTKAPYTLEIPPTQIVVGEKNLNVNSIAYRSYPNGISVDVTPYAAANRYSFPPSGAGRSYYLVVNVNGQPLSRFTYNAQSFCVGQNLTFSFSGLPLGTTPAEIQWRIDGTYVNAASNAVPGKTFPECSLNYYFDSDQTLLARPTVQGWWTSGSDPLYKASVRCAVVFPDGSRATAESGDYYYGMHRPKLVKYSKANPPIDVYLLHNHQYGITPQMQAYNPLQSDILATVQADYSVAVDSAVNGKVIITQLMNAVATNQSYRFIDTHGSNWLDNRAVYVGHDVLAGQATNSTITFDDPPHLWCSGITKYKASFTDYIQFRPGTAPVATNNGNIFVTLGTVTWNTYSQTAPATNNGVIDFNPRRTNIPDITQSIDGFGQSQMDNNFTPSDSFPKWNRVIFNSTTNY